MAAKTLDFAQKTDGKYELILVRSGWAKVPGRHDTAMSEGEPLPVALASVYVRPTPTSQLTPLHRVSMCPASQPIRVGLCSVAAPLARLSPTSFEHPPCRYAMRRLIMDKISLFLTNDGELDDRARGDRQQHRAAD